MTHLSFGGGTTTVEEPPRPVAQLIAPPVLHAPEAREPLDHEGAPPAARAAVGVGVGTRRSTEQSKRPRRTYSFIGGCLIGIAVSLTVFALAVEEGGGGLLLFGPLTLASAGIGMHLRGAKG